MAASSSPAPKRRASTTRRARTGGSILCLCAGATTAETCTTCGALGAGQVLRETTGALFPHRLGDWETNWKVPLAGLPHLLGEPPPVGGTTVSWKEPTGKSTLAGRSRCRLPGPRWEVPWDNHWGPAPSPAGCRARVDAGPVGGWVKLPGMTHTGWEWAGPRTLPASMLGAKSACGLDADLGAPHLRPYPGHGLRLPLQTIITQGDSVHKNKCARACPQVWGV